MQVVSLSKGLGSSSYELRQVFRGHQRGQGGCLLTTVDHWGGRFLDMPLLGERWWAELWMWGRIGRESLAGCLGWEGGPATIRGLPLPSDGAVFSEGAVHTQNGLFGDPREGGLCCSLYTTTYVNNYLAPRVGVGCGREGGQLQKPRHFLLVSQRIQLASVFVA